MSNDLRLIRVEPQPEYIEASGRWKWPLSPPHDNDGRCPHVYTASREWWEYVPSDAKPDPWAEGVRLRDDVWYWALPVPGGDYETMSRDASRWRALVNAPHLMIVDFEARQCGTFKPTKEAAVDRHMSALDVSK